MISAGGVHSMADRNPSARSNSDPAIHAEGVVRRFGRFRALDGFDLRIETGSVFGLVGKNGAGKTTAFHVLLGLIPANKGTISFLGLNPARRNVQVLKHVGFFPEKDEPYPWMKVRTLFAMGAAAYPTWDKKTCRDLCKTLELDRRKRVSSLSMGMVAKTKLIFALSHHPKCLVLDEPTAGLDPVSQHEILTIIARLTAERKVTTLISSHNLDNVASIATDIGIIHEGRVIFTARMDQINDRIAVLQLADYSNQIPDRLRPSIIKTKTRTNITQWLVWNMFDKDLKDFLDGIDTHFSLKDVSLEDLFIFLTTDEMLELGETDAMESPA